MARSSGERSWAELGHGGAEVSSREEPAARGMGLQSNGEGLGPGGRSKRLGWRCRASDGRGEGHGEQRLGREETRAIPHRHHQRISSSLFLVTNEAWGKLGGAGRAT
ncbi:hypothetical protein PR202_ga25515 [Eleusine coracana subsp. coracana]|uniref:Uncharacterized protein n=1 Tax=Eleusine coracana subsp. coracana TaxID=191504 RepID=A0AAV5DBK9_ELECO|nr:hypothetical protein PR202_ga25515 [Eleusine coracana subsp. coracana]